MESERELQEISREKQPNIFIVAHGNLPHKHSFSLVVFARMPHRTNPWRHERENKWELTAFLGRPRRFVPAGAEAVAAFWKRMRE